MRKLSCCAAAPLTMLVLALSAFCEEPAKVEVKFELKANLIVVKAKINGVVEKDFVLDTGASITVLTPAVAEELKLPRAQEAQAAGAGGMADAGLVSVDRIEVGGAVVEGLTCATMALKEVVALVGGKIGGVLGFNFLSEFKVTIDYKNRFLTLEKYIREVSKEPFTIDGNVFTSNKFKVKVTRPDETWEFVTKTPLPQIPVMLNKKDTDATAMVTVQTLAGLSLKEAVPSIDMSIGAQVKGFKKLSGGMETIGGRECYAVNYTGSQDGVQIKARHVFWMNGDDLVSLNCYSPEGEYEKFKADFEKIIAGFEFVK